MNSFLIWIPHTMFQMILYPKTFTRHMKDCSGRYRFLHCNYNTSRIPFCHVLSKQHPFPMVKTRVQEMIVFSPREIYMFIFKKLSFFPVSYEWNNSWHGGPHRCNDVSCLMWSSKHTFFDARSIFQRSFYRVSVSHSTNL